ncbi:MAG: fatty acid cis/trans isomerase, partial [Gammaproteobacteria bacterium]|nr:fatty acid cis/trans isomerase [Gammaproteobacteria bacterium]
LQGNYPESAWVIDYPLLERIHYLLVAGFNVFGNVGHQLTSRLYMDFLRMEGEDYFLAFLPSGPRTKIRDSWYAGVREIREDLFNIQSEWLKVDAISGYTTANQQKELYDHIIKRLSPVNTPDMLNRCDVINCQAHLTRDDEQRVQQAMQRIASIKGQRLEALPDLALLKVITENRKEDLVYTLIRNKAYKNVTSILEDAAQRDNEDLANDSLTVLKGIEGAYPNFFFTVDINEIEYFADEYLKISDRVDYEKFVARFGVRRTNPEFWQVSDEFQNYYARKEPLASGILDLNRYNNR